MLRKYIRTALFVAGMITVMAGSAFAADIILMEDGKTRTVDSANFNEQDYINRGYVKNTDAKGNVIYVFVSKSDVKPDNQLRGPDGDAPLLNQPGGGITRPVQP